MLIGRNSKDMSSRNEAINGKKEDKVKGIKNKVRSNLLVPDTWRFHVSEQGDQNLLHE